MKKLLLLFTLVYLAFATKINAQIVAGPMLGYAEMREALLWIQTEKAAAVQFKYWDKENPSAIKSTDLIYTSAQNFFIAKALASDVLPGKKYEYAVYINKKKINFNYPLEFQTQTLWQFRTDPPSFKFAAGSCVYTNQTEFDRPGKPYGYTFDIFNKIYDQDPDFMVWGGDNIYLREVDWNTRSGIYKRYIDFKRQPELQKLFARTHNYATWDDHDYGPNDADRSFWGKNWALEAFKDNWGNPNYIFKDEAVTSTFFWEDCQFFVLDDRWFRAPNRMDDPNKDYYGQKQIDWLIDALIGSSAPFKFIVAGGQVVNPLDMFENMAAYPGERQQLLNRISEHKISGVFFISGDRHHTILRKYERAGNYPIYDLTLSSITSGIAKPNIKEIDSPDVVPGTLIEDLQNFGILEVSGERTNRVLKINTYDSAGVKRWEYSINAKDLRASK